MKKQFNRRQLSRTKGFALVLTLSLLGFLLLLVLALASSLRIETQISNNDAQLNNARQNALIGLNLALVQLQELAGPDQRVTATRSLEPNSDNLPNGQKYWTGVWDASNPTSPLGWLVSDTLINEAEVTFYNEDLKNEPVNLVYNSVLEDEEKVKMRRQPIRSKGLPGFEKDEEKVIGNFAYWISDEGVKASALKIELPLPEGYNNQRFFQLSNRKTDLKKAFAEIDLEDEPTKRDLEQTFTVNQLESIKGNSENKLRRVFHEVTGASLGVLANTLDGANSGLKNDLTQLENLPNGTLSINMDLINFLNFPGRSDYVEVRGVTLGGGEPTFSIPLVVPEFSLRIGLSRISTNGPINIDLNLQADLWNPFTLPVNTIPFNSTEAPKLFFQIEGLPSLRVTYSTDGIERESYVLSPRDAESDSENPLELEINPPNAFRAGEILNVSKNFRLISDQVFVDATPDKTDDDQFTISATDSLLRFTLLDRNGLVLQDFINVPFSGIEEGSIIPMPILPTIDDIESNEMHVQFWFRFLDENSALEDWATSLDPRGPRFNFETNQEVARLIDVGQNNYSATENFSKSEFFSSSGVEGHVDDFYRFFDLPTIEPISIASLRHLSFDSGQPNYLGSPDAKNQNRVFDEWFFSTLPKTDTESSDLPKNTTNRYFKRPFLNPHILVQGNAETKDIYGYSEVAKQAMLFGAFNINCTSPEVWVIILSGNDFEKWQDSDLENPFFRFPFTADHFHKNPTFRRSWYKRITGENEKPEWAPSYTVGVRELTDNQLEELSEEIVAQIKLLAKPSTSVSDFINRGILQNAINNSTINTTGNTSKYVEAPQPARIPLNAPAFLNQADILNTIAPFIQARSDTFRIRAYGDAVNPVTGKLEGRAWCEAWVQRYPELVDKSGDVTKSATGLGRKFKIVHFKWLDESQI